MMVNVILVGIFAGSDQREIGRRLAGGEEMDFAGGVAGDGEEQISAGAGARDFDAKALVEFVIDQGVGFRCAESMAKEAVGVLRGRVFDGIEERAIVSGPGGAGDSLDARWQRFVFGKVFDLDCVLAIAVSVEREGEEMVLVGDGEGAETEEGVSLRKEV